MANAVMMYDALGYRADDPRATIARAAIEKLLVVKDERGLLPALPVAGLGYGAGVPRAAGSRRRGRDRAGAATALDWLQPLQVLDVKGDWAAQRPDVRPGGWAFQYANPHYPDLDDTAVVVMAMDRARRADGRQAGYDHGDRPRHANGSWACRARMAAGAPSMPTTLHHYLNNIPFADHGALLDPPTADVTARCVSMLAQLGETAPTSPALARGVDYLLQEQEADGSLVRPLGHELHLRHLVGALRAERRRRRPPTIPPMRKAVDWLVAHPERRMAAGARTARATSSTTRPTSRRRAPRRRPPGRCWR